MSSSYAHDFPKHNHDILNGEMRKWKELREDCTLKCKIEGWYDLYAKPRGYS